MSDAGPFTDNYRDLSTEDGYQFEFICDRCSNGYRSPFATDIKARGKGMLRMAGSMLGGRLRSLSYAAETTRWGGGGAKARDKALADAVEHVRPQFEQCRGCGSWVCREVCWNEQAGRCEGCAGLGAEGVAGSPSSDQVDQAGAAASAQSASGALDPGAGGQVQCPACNAVVEGGKFCAECGAKLQRTAFCANCGAELKDGAKFCAECGTRA